MDDDSSDDLFSCFKSERFPSGIFEYFANFVYESEVDKNSMEIPDESSNNAILQAFENLSLEDKICIEAEFFRLRTLTCKERNKNFEDFITVRNPNVWHRVHVQHYDYSKGSLKLEDLPGNVFASIMNSLSTMDIFRMTLVCKHWRTLVYENGKDLKKSEYNIGLYLMECSRWEDDDSECEFFEEFVSTYEEVMFNSTYMCCKLSNNLETLILDETIDIYELGLLLQHCPNLKHLAMSDFSCKEFDQHKTDWLLTTRLPKLETLICGPSWFMDPDTLVDYLASAANSLRVLKCGFLEQEDSISTLLSKNILGSLDALDFTECTTTALKEMAKIDDVKLKYLRLGEYASLFGVDTPEDRPKTIRKYIYQMLSKMKNLEVLIVTDYHGVSNDILRLIIDLDLNLKACILCEPRPLCIYGCRAFNLIDEAELFDEETLWDLQEMLYTKDFDRDLSDFIFVINDEIKDRGVEDFCVDFTVLTASEFLGSPTWLEKFSLNERSVSRFVDLGY